jgi:hypothetical protein
VKPESILKVNARRPPVRVEIAVVKISAASLTLQGSHDLVVTALGPMLCDLRYDGYDVAVYPWLRTSGH